jgi:hypothetical protein
MAYWAKFMYAAVIFVSLSIAVVIPLLLVDTALSVSLTFANKVTSKIGEWLEDKMFPVLEWCMDVFKERTYRKRKQEEARARKDSVRQYKYDRG